MLERIEYVCVDMMQWECAVVRSVREEDDGVSERRDRWSMCRREYSTVTQPNKTY